jgi:hypothetical protein
MPAGLVSVDEEAKYTTWLAGVSQAIRDYCKWDLGFHSNETRYYDGNGSSDLVLTTPFTWADSTLAVYVDMAGAYGLGPNAFAATLLTLGTDYVPRIEMQQMESVSGSPVMVPKSKSGVLTRLTSVNNGLWWPSDLFFRPTRSGGLAWGHGSFWPSGRGNIKVVCNYGFKALPESIKTAAAKFVSIVRRTMQQGMLVTSESLGDYSWTGALQQWQELGDVRQLLSPYRDTQL